MMREEDIERVRAEADIVSIIGGYVALKRKGRDFRGPCPFHNGTNDNFSVRSSRPGTAEHWRRFESFKASAAPGGHRSAAGFRCFVCGVYGDVFGFVQQHLGLDFPSAVKHVAETVGITIRDTADRTEPNPREPLWEANEAAAAFFARELEADGGAAARAYLAGRELSVEQAMALQLGLAPRGDRLRAHLTALGIDDARAVLAGVLVAPEGGGAARGRFYDRLMFPIRDLPGHLAGFGGRALDDREPKYLNSADSPIFRKGDLLYGLDVARSAIRATERALVVEGYFDVIRIRLAGITEVVAPMGTTMTPAQAGLIRRFAATAFLLYDRDAAGLKATFRAGDQLLAAGVAVRVVTLPDGDDPDTFARREGAAGVESAIAESVDLLDRKIELLEVGGYFGDVAAKREAFERLLPTLTAPADPLIRGLYIARSADALGLSASNLEDAVTAAAPRRGTR